MVAVIVEVVVVASVAPASDYRIKTLRVSLTNKAPSIYIKSGGESMEEKTFQRTFNIQWHITNRCDQRCKHCYIYQSKEALNPVSSELNFQQCQFFIKDFLKFCQEMECNPGITITGGDPLLSPIIWQLLDYFKNQELSFSILGNPFHLNKNVCSRLRELGCRSYQMSLDGLEATHDYLRKRGSFSVTIGAFELLKEAKIKTVVMTTVSKLNCEELPKLTELIVRQGIDICAFARYVPTNGDLKYNMTPLEYKKFLSKMWKIYKRLLRKGTSFTLKDHLWTLFLYEKGLITPRKERVIFEGCNCGIRHLSILSDGIVYACRRFESPVGNIKYQGLKDIFLGKEMNKYRKIERLEGCDRCELLYHCRGCHAVAYGTFGNYFAKDPQCWKK